MISDEKQRTQWGCRSCVIVREVWRRGEGWGWEVVGFITVTYIGHYISTLYITYIRHYISALFNLSFMFIHCHKR